MNLFVYSENNPIIHIDPNGTSPKKISDLISGTIPKKPKLNDLWPYDKKVPGKKKLGKNVQREHPNLVAIRKHQRTTPGGTQYHNRRVSAKKGQPTILLETGKATGKQPAKPHTQIKKTQMEILKDVRSGKLRSESEMVGRIQKGYDEVNKSLAAQEKPQIPKKVVDTAILADQATIHVTPQETAKELGNLGSPAKTAKDIDKAIESVDVALDALHSPKRPGVGRRLGKAIIDVAKQEGKAAKVLPVLGILAGGASAVFNFLQGHKTEGILDVVGFIPGPGDAVDATRLAYDKVIETIDTTKSIRENIRKENYGEAVLDYYKWFPPTAGAARLFGWIFD
jgi:hypothetical protein